MHHFMGHGGIMGAVEPLSPAFATYLIQDNNYVRAWLIKDRFAAMADADAVKLLLFIPGVTLLTFLACVAIDALRDRLFRWLRIRQRLNALETALRQKLPAGE